MAITGETTTYRTTEDMLTDIQERLAHIEEMLAPVVELFATLADHPMLKTMLRR